MTSGRAILWLSCTCGLVGVADARRVHVQGRQLFLGDEPFLVKGICYSPIPINESVYFAPYGDYFTADYSFIWLRDLPLIKAMGVNVVRTYGWQPDNDHSAFLDAVANNGMYMMATFYMGSASESPVGTPAERAAVVSAFTNEVAKYASHPSLLFWSFGNELNGVWNEYLQQLSKSGKTQCNWDERYDDLGGCWVHKGTAPKEGDVCYDTSYCVYSRLFSFIDDAARAAKEVADVLVVSAFADVDAMSDKIMRAGHLAPSLDAWTAQVYRGDSFGDFFASMGNATSKPVLLTEYGVDAYHDACGTGKQTPCYNVLGDSSDSYEDEESQAYFAGNLTLEINAAASDKRSCKAATMGWQNCTCIGGFLMSWADEYWKGSKAQAGCDPTIDDPKFSTKTCDPKAHVTCGNWDTSQHDLCGYFLDAAPDHYVNEEWFGITSPSECASAIDALRARETYWAMRSLWTGKTDRDEVGFPTCDEMVRDRCIELGNGGGQPIFGFVFGPSDDAGTLPCSGHGTCTTDWSECGAGASNESATPCCSCQPGFAGVGCAELDARVYVGLGAGAALLALLVTMLLISTFTAICRKGIKGELAEPLMR